MLLFFLAGNITLGQTITSLESRCVNNGSIIIGGTIGSGGPYQLSIIDHPSQYTPGPTLFPAVLPDTFTALFPGDYTVKVVDGAGEIFLFQDIVVAGNYILPGNNDYNPVADAVTNCAVANGSISGSMTNGRPPYSYTILNGPAQAGVSNNTGTFTGLPAGTYRLQAEDSCRNIQTRELFVGGAAGSLSITGAAVSVINCDTFSLDAITVTPALLPGGRFEVINFSSTGTQVIRAAGSVLPVRFTLFSKADVSDRKVRVKVYDACGNFSIFIPVQFTNSPQYRISRVVINKISCDSMSLDSVYVSPALPPGAFYQVSNFNPGPGPVIYQASGLPFRFKASNSDFPADKIKVSIIDSCGDNLVTYTARDIKNKWDFIPDFSLNCNRLVINSIAFTGFIFQPYTITASAGFINNAGEPDSSVASIVSSFPHSIPGIPFGANPLELRISITDSCGTIVRYIKDLSFVLSEPSSEPSGCGDIKITLEPEGNYSLPVTYSVLPDSGAGSNTTGVFILSPGTYIFTATDSCGKMFAMPPKTFQRGWQLAPVEQSSLCHVGFITHRIAVPSASYGKLTLAQYTGGMPVAPGAVPINNKVFRSFANGCVSCNITDVTGEWAAFDSTLPAQTYSYILTDSCGKSDTVSVTNNTDGYTGFFRNTRVINKCINRGDIIASWRNDGPVWNTVNVAVLTLSGNPIFIFNTTSNTNMITHPNGQTLLSDYPPGTYIVEYSFSSCSLRYADTVTIAAYLQPVVIAAEGLSSCGTAGSTVIVTGASGLAPYSYQIVGSTPGNFTSTAQSNPVFNMPATQATVTVRIVDACLNSVTRTVAVTKAYPPVIRSNPAIFASCTLPFSFSLYTDSLYNGSVFEWTKITGTNAGSSVVGNRPSLALIYHSPADTGTWRVRVRVPNTCYDFSAYFTVPPVAVTCMANLSGMVLNDANGLSDNTVNGRGTNAGGLYVSLINEGGTVAALAAVASNGAYQLLDVPPGNYSLVLSTVAGAINGVPPLVNLPVNWVNTGEHINILQGDDGVANGKLVNINVNTAAVSNLNFGIEQLPVARDTTEARVNPGSNIRIPVPVMTGSDAEDGIYDGVSGINKVVIQTVPPNAVLYYNGVAVMAGQVIGHYNPALLTMDPNDNIAAASFTFSVVDAAMQQSTPATATIVFYGLPVSIIHFTATAQKDRVVINWKVGEQLNIVKYIIESSADGISFAPAGTVTAANIQAYSFNHVSPVHGINFYRLKIIESDGSFSYSKTVSVNVAAKGFVQVLPNPFSSTISLVIPLQKSSLLKVFICDAAGKKVYENTVKGVAGNNYSEIRDLQNLSRGVYIITIVAGDIVFNYKLLKE